MTEPRCRAVSFVLDRGTAGDGLTLEGYAAVFGETIRVWDPWDGEYLERFERGAFAKTIKERTPYLMLQHGRHPLVGPIPIGAFEALYEDARGLSVRARLHDNWLVQPVRDAIASGALSGMSIMFEPAIDKRDDTGDVPLIIRKEVRLLELGPVVFPAYKTTEVGVRSIADLNDLRLFATSRTAAATGLDDPAGSTVDSAAGDPTTAEAVDDPDVRAAYARLMSRRYPAGGIPR